MANFVKSLMFIAAVVMVVATAVSAVDNQGPAAAPGPAEYDHHGHHHHHHHHNHHGHHHHHEEGPTPAPEEPHHYHHHHHHHGGHHHHHHHGPSAAPAVSPDSALAPGPAPVTGAAVHLSSAIFFGGFSLVMALASLWV